LGEYGIFSDKLNNYTKLVKINIGGDNLLILKIDHFIPINNQNDLEDIFPRLIKLIAFS